MPITPEVYFRLFVRHNQAVWPSQGPLLALGAAVLWLAWCGRGRIAGVLLGTCWMWVGLAFHLNLYAELNWAAAYAGWGFILQGILLAGFAGLGRPAREPGARLTRAQNAGIALGVFGLVVYPVLGPLTGRSWGGVELFGTAPDPTVLVTLGVLPALARPVGPAAMIPALWCIVSGLTWYAMGWYPGLLVPAAALVFAVLGIRFARRRES